MEVLQKLVCERCSRNLSRRPVHLVEDCPYREYLCPIAESGQCEWTGLQTGILKHCQQDHRTNVVENPYKCTYDITRPSVNNYILFTSEVLFLIQSKVCTATRKIYHAVRLIGDSARVSDFKYTLDIENKHGRLTKYGNVMPRELLVLQKDTSLVTGINSLLEMLGDFKDTTFTVTIECSGQGANSSETPDHTTPPVKALKVTVRCVECATVTEPIYRGDWMCKKHAPQQRTCGNEECTYSDIYTKCAKHEWYFCQYSIWCSICCKDITGTTVDSHCTQAHGNITHRAGTVCTVRPTVDFKPLIIDCNFGRAVCEYMLTITDFRLWVYTPLPSAKLYKYRCTVELGHPTTGHTLTRTLAVRYSDKSDWIVCIPRSDYNARAHHNKINIKINITKIDDPSQFMA